MGMSVAFGLGSAQSPTCNTKFITVFFIHTWRMLYLCPNKHPTDKMLFLCQQQHTLWHSCMFVYWLLPRIRVLLPLLGLRAAAVSLKSLIWIYRSIELVCHMHRLQKVSNWITRRPGIGEGEGQKKRLKSKRRRRERIGWPPDKSLLKWNRNESFAGI